MSTPLSHMQKQLSKIRERIHSLGTEVFQQVLRSMQAFNQRDDALADTVIAADRGIDEAEVDLEEECLKILALYQPVASDLRLLVAIMKINNDLERIGDLAVNIAKRACTIAQQNIDRSDLNIGAMMEKTRQMLEQCLQALTDMNPQQAQAVRMMDDEVDELNRDMFKRALQEMRQHPEHLEVLMSQLTVSRHLERIADHATNIAEDVIYMAQGSIVRHHQLQK